MKPRTIRYQQLLPVDLETTFGFFADAANLDRLTPPWLHFQILSQLPLAMHAGTRIDYRLKLHGISITWQSQITVWEPPLYFVDEQREGPYRLWRHTHGFEAIGADATLVSDEVQYTVPGGSIIDQFLVRPDLERIFRYRRDELQRWALTVLKERLSASEAGGSSP